MPEIKEKNYNIIYDKIRLFLYGISIPSSYPEDYPLHRAVFQKDFSLL